MKFRRFKRINQDDLTTKITPINLIDVFLLLLIFFMLSTTFSINTGVDIKLPESNLKEVMENKEIVVSITKDKTVFINSSRVELSEFSKVLSEKMQEVGKQNIIIKADKDLAYGFTVKIMTLSKNAGATELDLATESEKVGE